MEYFVTGLKQMKQQLVNVDCIIEVHDSRVSFGPIVSTITQLIFE